jgi:Protein of unknown function (DUF1569)
MVNTRSVKNRRHLRFESFDQVVRDAELLAEAERAGTLRALGNWKLGQAIGHLANWARYPLDGYPPLPTPPWLLRVIVPLLKGRFLNKGLPAGARIPSVPEGTFGAEPMETDQALAALREALPRLQSQMPAIPNPILGPLTHDEWIKLNLRHAELHLSFFQPN